MNKIFRVRGTPSKESWANLKDLPLYKDQMPFYEPQSLAKYVPGLDPEGLDLLDKMLKCRPEDRITAKDALSHPFLKDVPEYVKNLK